MHSEESHHQVKNMFLYNKCINKSYSSALLGAYSSDLRVISSNGLHQTPPTMSLLLAHVMIPLSEVTSHEDFV